MAYNASTNLWQVFKESAWVQNNIKETVTLGKTLWLISTDGCVKREAYNLEGKHVATIQVNQHWKGKPKKFLCIPTGEYIHRLVAKWFIPNDKNHKHVRFIDGDVSNVNVDNLEWYTITKKGILLGKRKKINNQ